MDPFAPPDAVLHIRSIDLRAMDVIGWDVRTLAGDFSFDGALDIIDIDLLVSEIVRKSEDTGFDISADGLVDRDDLAMWLVTATAHNGFSEAYPLGDANLDGHVDAGHDLNQLGIHWLQNVARWSAGDFTADGMVDSGDLNKLALNWRRRNCGYCRCRAKFNGDSGCRALFGHGSAPMGNLGALRVFNVRLQGCPRCPHSLASAKALNSLAARPRQDALS